MSLEEAIQFGGPLVQFGSPPPWSSQEAVWRRRGQSEVPFEIFDVLSGHFRKSFTAFFAAFNRVMDANP